MRKFRYSLLVLGVAAVVGVAASPALAKKPAPKKPAKVVFAGSYAGQATNKVDGNTVTIAANGKGTGTLIGAGSITGQGTGDSSQQPCIPFGGTGSITGTAGTTIGFKLVSGASACGDEGGHTFSVTGHLTVVSATGKLAKAKGTLKFTGVYSRDDGTFSIKLTGTLTK